MAEMICIVAYAAIGLAFALWAKSAIEARGKSWLVSGPYAPLVLTMIVAIWLPLMLAAVLTEILEGSDHGR